MLVVSPEALEEAIGRQLALLATPVNRRIETGRSPEAGSVLRIGDVDIQISTAVKTVAKPRTGRREPVVLHADIAQKVWADLAGRARAPRDIAVRTANEVYAEVVRTAQKEHDTLRLQDIQELTAIYARHNYGDDPLVRARTIMRENARRRAQFLTSQPLLTAREIAEQAGHQAGNVSATASRWKSAGRIFSLSTPEGDQYPAFQFDDGKPRSEVARVLEALPKTMSGWQIAFWFTSANPSLDMRVPADCLTDIDAVVAAAVREAELVLG